jgi:hypothetical protein
MIDVTKQYDIRQTSKLAPFSVMLALADFIVHFFTVYDEDFDSRDPPGVWELFYDGVSTKVVVATASLELAVRLKDGETLVVGSYIDRVEFVLLDEHRRRVQLSIGSLASSITANHNMFKFSVVDEDEHCVMVSNGVDAWTVKIRQRRVSRLIAKIPCIRWIIVFWRGSLGSLMVDKR